MTREQLDALLDYIDAKIDFRSSLDRTGGVTYPVRQRLVGTRSALYATVEKHTPLEDVTDAELCGQVED